MRSALILIAAVGMLVAACKDRGQHLGQFKTMCAEKKGTIVEISNTQLQCKLPDGKVLNSR